MNSYQATPGLIALHNKNNMSLLNELPVLAQGGLIFNPGLAWAAKKDVFARHGFYDQAIIGAGDLYMANGIFGTMNSIIKFHSVNKYRAESYLNWARPFHTTVANKVGYIPGEIYHLWHGDIVNRNYRNRFKILADFDPLTDVYIGDNGAWHWTKQNTELERAEGPLYKQARRWMTLAISVISPTIILMWWARDLQQIVDYAIKRRRRCFNAARVLQCQLI